MYISVHVKYPLFLSDFFVFQFAVQTFKIEIYGNIILPILLYGCETWPLTLGRNVS
jgi:hypothetical protein